MAVIGIDLGTTNSLAAAFIDGKPVLIPNAFGEHLTPSAVSFLSNGSVAVGKVARERRATDPENTVVEFKRRMGGNEAFHAGGRSFYPKSSLPTCCVSSPRMLGAIWAKRLTRLS